MEDQRLREARAGALWLLALSLAASPPATGGGEGAGEPTNLPAELAAACYAEPCRLVGDFDGDGRTDLAVLAVERAAGRRGIVLLHASGEVVRLGAGIDFGNGGADWRWLDAWRLLEAAEREAIRRVDPALPALSGDAFVVAKRGAASALVHRAGAAYRWYQLSD